MSTVIAKKIFLAILLLFLIHTGNCRFLQKREKTLPLTFDYAKISTNYFSPANEDPYPLTIQRGDNLYNSTTSDGKTLFYTTNNRGNYDIWFRDLKSSIIVPVTSHPAPEYKPAISPDGTKLAFVSEQYDSEGDIFFLEMNPKKWKEAYLKGERFINTDFKNISNPNYSDPKNARRYIDTDPCWSPDGKFLAYSTESLSPGLQNIVIYELKTKKIIKQITSEGGTSPYWALDGRYISYISYKNHSNGEIYRYDLQTNTHERLTHNEYIEYSPSLSPNGNILFYTSVRNPQKKEKGKEITDNGMIIRYNVSQKKEQHLSSETFPVFDTRYSRFGCADELEQFMNPVQKQKYREECGSILFSASLYNTINVYFIPAEGSIPKQATIEEQFNFALRYQKYQSYEGVVLALDSIKLFFEEDPLYPIFKAKAEMFKAQLNENSGRHDKAKQIIEEQLKQKNQKDGFYPYALASIFHKEGKRGTLETLEQYYDSVKAEKLIPLQQKYAILELIGEEREAINKRALSIEAYARILNEFPEYYNTNTIKQKISRLKFYSEQEIIPAYYLELINNPAIKRSRLNTIQNDIEKNIWKNRNYVEVNQLIDKLNQKEELQKQCAGLHRLLIYIKAKALYEGKDFQNSLGLINSYIGVYEAKPIIDPANKASVFDRKFDFDDPLYLKSLWLRAKNYEGLGTLQGDNGEGFFNQMKFFLVNYDDTFGVEIAEEEIEKSFRYYENQARKYTNQYFETKRKLASAKNIPDKEKKIQDNLKILRSAAIHYFYNTENMFLLKSKNLYLNTLYSQYAIYYYKKMIDSAFIYGKEIREHNSKAVLDFLNTNIVGTSTNFLSKVATNTYTSKVTDKLKVLGDFRDLKIEEVLGEDALFIINQHFKEGIPRARNYLYLAAIYGYAYYLIGKAIIYEDFYNQTGMMTPNRKEKILNDLKKAELELKWAIFANPQFADAYQLLGWLYQYVDVSKTQKLYSDSVSVGEEYESEYNIHFPGRHLEENVELYRQILDFLGEAPDKKLLSDLNLNLANNYLLLNSYPKAKEHYAKVEEYGKSIIDTSRFENYRQKALFHYNYARTLLYLGNYEQSSEEFGKVADIYLNNEFYKAYALGEANPGTQSESIHYVAKKLVLINALGGLAEMEGGNFRQAIRSLRRAVSYNAEVHLIPDYSLYNFLAICYQQVEDYSTANYFVKLAIEKNTDKNEKEKTESYFWELILPRKNRVHGDSRFPGGFPPIYQYLLSKGIEIKNFEEQREYSETLKLLNEREAFIKKNELDSMPSGQSILSNTISRKAYNEYKQGEFINSAKTYKESYEYFLKKQDYKLFRIHFESYNYALFKTIEIAVIPREEAILALNENLKLLKNEKKRAISECMIPFTTTEIDLNNSKQKEKCEIEFFKEWKYYEPLMGMNYNYLGDAYSFAKEPQKAYYYYGQSFAFLKNPGRVPEDLIGLKGDLYSKKERLKLLINLARLHYKLKEDKAFIKTIQAASDFAVEFEALEEQAKINLLYADYLLQLPEDKRNYQLALSKLLESEKLILNNYTILLDTNVSFFTNLYNAIKDVRFHLKDYDSLYLYDEKLQNIILFKNLNYNKFSFENPKFQSAYSHLKTMLKKQEELEEEIGKRINKREAVAKYIEERKNFNEKVKKYVSSLAESFPEKSDFFNFTVKDDIQNKLSNKDVVLRFLTVEDHLLYWIISSRSKKRGFVDLEKGKFIIQLTEIIQSNWNSLKNFSNLIIIPDDKTVSYDFKTFPLNGKNLIDFIQIHYAFRSSHITFKPEMESLRFKDYTNITKNESLSETSLEDKLYNTDILEGNILFKSSNIYNESLKGYINLKELFQKEHKVSMLVLPSISYKKDNYQKLVSIIDIVRSSGIPLVALFDKDHTDIQEELQNKKLSIYEFPKKISLKTIGFHSIPKGNTLSYRSLRLRARLKENEGKIKEALDIFYSADSLLAETDKNSLQSQIDLARIKSKYFKKTKPFLFYEALLGKYKDNSNFRVKSLLALVKYCYTYYPSSSCKNYVAELTTAKNDAKLSLSEKKAIIASLNFYKSLDKGKLAFLEKRIELFEQFAKPGTDFLSRYELALIFFQNYIPEKAIYYAKEALKKANTPSQSKLVYSLLDEVKVNMELLELQMEGLSRNFNKESIYVHGLNRDWKKYNSELSLMDERIINSKDLYRKKVFEIWKKIETGEDYEPLYLVPDKTSTGKSMFFILDQTDKSLVFYLLKNSLSLQVENEVNQIFDLLVNSEIELGNQNIVYHMTISWASTLYSQGDYESAFKYLKTFEDKYLNYVGSEASLTEYYLLKYKLSFIKKELVLSEKDDPSSSRWFQYYQYVASFKGNEYLSYLQRVIKENANQYLDHRNTRELLDFITFLLEKSNKDQNVGGDVSTDLIFYRDRVLSINERLLGRIPKFQDLPPVEELTADIQKKIPANQTFIVVTQQGLRNRYILIRNKQAIASDILFQNGAYEDARKFKKLIFDYHRTVKETGSNLLQKEFIESLFRNAIFSKENWEKINYVYLSSYLIKTPLELHENDNFYLVQNPRTLIENRPHSLKSDFEKGFRISRYLPSKIQRPWFKHLLEVESLEVKTGGNSRSTVSISSEELRLFEEREILFGNANLLSLKSYSKRPGPWIINYSSLYNTSFITDDINYSLYYISTMFEGPGVFSIGQQNDLHQIMFLKTLTARKEIRQDLKFRYIQAMDELKKRYPQENYWNGYRLYTTSFVIP